MIDDDWTDAERAEYRSVRLMQNKFKATHNPLSAAFLALGRRIERRVQGERTTDLRDTAVACIDSLGDAAGERIAELEGERAELVEMLEDQQRLNMHDDSAVNNWAARSYALLKRLRGAGA